jgi:hypothetical protein
MIGQFVTITACMLTRLDDSESPVIGIHETTTRASNVTSAYLSGVMIKPRISKSLITG